MRFLWRAPLLKLLRRDPDEISRRAARFAIQSEEGREQVTDLGRAFLGGFNAMLSSPGLEAVAREGMKVASHDRPFFFEGAAMGYLPRGLLRRGPSRRAAERDLLGMNPDFLYLYYVGLGFWFGLRYRRPASLRALADRLDPMYFPLCYDGFGFKLAFYDYPSNPAVVGRLNDCEEAHRPALYQGFGRALFFVFMDDAAGFDRLRDSLPREHRGDMECGRALALAFTQVHKPDRLRDHIDSARGDEELEARLTGVTWALAARRMSDAGYFRRCLAAGSGPARDLLEPLPDLCDKALSESRSYAEWQARTREAARHAHHETTASRSDAS